MKNLRYIALAVLLIFTIGRTDAMEERSFTRNTLFQLKEAVDAYHKQYRAYPPTSLPEFLLVLQGANIDDHNPKRIVFIELPKEQAPLGLLLDGWGRPFIFSADIQDDRLQIWSLGADGLLDKEGAVRELLYQQLIPAGAEQGAAANP